MVLVHSTRDFDVQADGQVQRVGSRRRRKRTSSTGSSLVRRGAQWGGHGGARLGPARPLGELDREAAGELDVD
jgi:hypothetical protein